MATDSRDLIWGGYARISEDPDDLREGVGRQTVDIPEAIVALGGTPPDLDGPFMWIENDTSAYKRRRVTITDHYGETRDAWRVVRPLWAEAMRALRQGRINALMVYDLDRLARDPYDLEDAIEVVTRYGAIITSATASEIDLTTESGVLTARITVIIANKASADTARRVARKHLDLAREGKPVGGNRPFGFKKDKVEHDPVEVAVLQEVVDEILTGRSIRDVVVALNTAGVKTTKGNQWTSQTLKQLLRSPRLAGWRVYQGKVALDIKGEPVRGQWDPIIEQDTWDALQLMVTPKPDARKRIPRRDARHYLLTGIVRCGICNGPLYGNAHKGGKFYYVCSPKTLPLDHGLGGSGKAIDRLVTMQVLDRLAAINTDTEVQVAQWEGAARVAEIDVMIRDAMEHLRKGTLSAPVVIPHVQALEAEKSELEAERVEYLAASNLTRLGAITPDEWQTLSLDQQRTYIEAVLEAVIVQPATRRGNAFDPQRLVYVWRESAGLHRTRQR